MSPKQHRHWRGKRWLDLVFAFVGMALTLPLMALAAVAIRLETKGPIVYSQKRLGLHRRPFRILKLRTMRVHAEQETGPVWCRRGDPRVTRVGRVLRATHIDELPQLVNVLCGQMSLVGPRPEREFFVRQYDGVVPGYGERFETLPGITGLSQLRSGYDDSERSVRKKIRYDCLYVRRGGVRLDLSVVLATGAQLTRHGVRAVRSI